MTDLTIEQQRAIAMANARMRAAQATAQPAPAAAPEKSWGDTITDAGMGAWVGARGVMSGGGQLLAKGLEAVSPKGSALERFAQEQAVKSKGYQDAAETRGAELTGDSTAYNVGKVGGGIAGSLPVAAVVPGAGAASLGVRTLSGAGSGALAAAAQPTEDNGNYWANKGQQVGIGAGAGAATAPLAGALARFVSPRASTNANVQTLLDEGVGLTPGQMGGGVVKSLEDKAISVPLLGSIVSNAQRRGTEDLNRVAINRALAPIGQELPRDIAVGRAGVDFAQEALDNAYGALLPQLTVRVDQQFGNEVGNVLRSTALRQELRQELQDTVAERVLNRFNNGVMDGQTMKEVESELGVLARDAMSSKEAGIRTMGTGLREIQRNLRELVERSNPQHAGELQAINRGYANMAVIDRAAGGAGAVEGVFSPNQLASAVRQNNQTVRKRGYAAGNALMQDLSDPAKALMPSSVANSGTADRLLAAGGWGALAGGGAGLAALLNPKTAAVLSPMLAYTRPGMTAAQYAMARRPQGAPALADALRRYGTPALASSVPAYNGVMR
jgi:hypothetical protein